MAIDISELRPDDLEEISELWQQVQPGSQTLPDWQTFTGNGQKLDSVLSLVAREEDKLVGAILCHGQHDGYRHYMAVAESHRDGELVRKLADKALLKLYSRGIHRCRIQSSDGVIDPSFWQSLNWLDHQVTSIDPPQTPAPGNPSGSQPAPDATAAPDATTPANA